MKDELARIRARVAQFREWNHRWLELGQQNEARTMGMAQYYERERLMQQMESAWAITDIEALLTIIDAQQAVVDAAGAVDAYRAAHLVGGETDAALDKRLDVLHDALATLKGAGNGTQSE